MSYCIDANVFITAWYQIYPPQIFPSLYQQIENKLSSNIIIIKPVFDQIEPITVKITQEMMQNNHPVRYWLEKNLLISGTPITPEVQQRALDLMNQYETSEKSKGADEIDIALIAYASLNNHVVVTLESEQKQPPDKIANYKIPLICQQENVECIDFVELLKQCDIKV